MEIAAIYGARFKLFRNELKLTQKELGDKIGKNQPTIAKYENGEYEIPREVIKILCKDLGLNLDWYYQGIKPIIVTQKITKQKTQTIESLTIELAELEKRVELLEQLLFRKNIAVEED